MAKGIKDFFVIQGSYFKPSLFLNRFINSAFALIVIICTSPFLLLISLVLKLVDGGPVFYRGGRLGINKEEFIMYKFRTLVIGAEQMIGAELLSTQDNMLRPCGKFLRATRLDELPQCFNVLINDMNLVGPRPVRPAIYEKFCKDIPRYDVRFSVKPGLVGYSQLFTPHSSPKKIRSMIDNKFITMRQNHILDISLVLLTTMVVIKKIITESCSLGKQLCLKVFFRHHEKRTLNRVSLYDAVVYIGQGISDTCSVNSKTLFRQTLSSPAKLVDINEEALLLHSKETIQDKKIVFKMERSVKGRIKTRLKYKTALCEGAIFYKSEIDDKPYKYLYVINYTPVSEFNSYRVHQYFLSQSMVR